MTKTEGGPAKLSGNAPTKRRSLVVRSAAAKVAVKAAKKRGETPSPALVELANPYLARGARRRPPPAIAQRYERRGGMPPCIRAKPDCRELRQRGDKLFAQVPTGSAFTLQCREHIRSRVWLSNGDEFGDHLG